MGQKVNPIGFRVHNGSKKTWTGSWFANKKADYRQNVVDDVKIYNFFHKNSSKLSVGKVFIERNIGKNVSVAVFSSKVNLVLGKKGEQIAQIENDLKKEINKSINIDVKEIKRPNLDANIVARMIADRIEKRQSFKRAVKSAMESVMKSGAVGIKVMCSGRLNNAEIARSEKFSNGVVSLHTLRADIDYACQEALTIYGIIGVKVWICIKR